jgi:peptidoglycan/xylan/chitin deacetylase (PgdA/CDA1 family)
MDASPLFTVHSHTKNHLRLPAITAAELASELVGSKQRLEQELGGSRNFLAYPFGDYNLNVINAAQAAGYTMAYAVGNKGAFGKPLHYLFTRKGVGRDITTIQKFKTRIGAI